MRGTAPFFSRVRGRVVLAWALGWVVRLWVATLRVRLAPGCELTVTGPRVIAFRHGHQMGLLAARHQLGHGATVLVSRSRDGDLQAVVMRTLGLSVVRGSSSRSGVGGLVGLVRALGSGRDALIAVDGPRGPRGVAKPGALHAARLGEATLVAAACAFSCTWVLRRTWDRFRVPLPFSTVTVATVPLVGGVSSAAPSDVTELLQVAGRRAHAALASTGDSWQSRHEPHVRQARHD